MIGMSVGIPLDPVVDRTDPIPDIDLADPDPVRLLAADRVLAGLRPEHRVFWHGAKSRPGFWAVIGYAETLKVYRDAATFSATHGMTLDSLRPEPDPASGMMVEVTDPPEHRRLRRSIGAFFADGVVGTLSDDIGEYVRDLLIGVREHGGTVDFVAAVAARIPTYAAARLLGLPKDDLDWITARTSRVFLSGPDQRAAAEQANSELLGYFATLLRTRAGAGIVQRLAAGTANRDALTTGEVVLNALNLAIGGTTTVRSLLSNLTSALIEHPEIFPALRAHPEAIAVAVEEAVRWANPVRHLARVATTDVELAGMRIRAGDPVVVWPRSANRDAAVFDRPDEFDMRRHPNSHIGFAAGPHSCPGSGLGRVQLRSMLRHTVELFDGIQASEPGELLRSNFMHGYATLPVRVLR